MYEWIAIFERHEIVEIEGGQEDVLRRIKKYGKVEAQYGQDVIMGVIEGEKKTGNLISFQIRRIDD